jgi:hypothetical protein
VNTARLINKSSFYWSSLLQLQKKLRQATRQRESQTKSKITSKRNRSAETEKWQAPSLCNLSAHLQLRIAAQRELAKTKIRFVLDVNERARGVCPSLE